MSVFYRCDNCRAETQTAGYLHSDGANEDWMEIDVASNRPENRASLTFCSWRCVGEYATTRSLLGGISP
jgi:hypothetical protein